MFDNGCQNVSDGGIASIFMVEKLGSAPTWT